MAFSLYIDKDGHVVCNERRDPQRFDPYANAFAQPDLGRQMQNVRMDVLYGSRTMFPEAFSMVQADMAPYAFTAQQAMAALAQHGLSNSSAALPVVENRTSVIRKQGFGGRRRLMGDR